MSANLSELKSAHEGVKSVVREVMSLVELAERMNRGTRPESSEFKKIGTRQRALAKELKKAKSAVESVQLYFARVHAPSVLVEECGITGTSAHKVALALADVILSQRWTRKEFASEFEKHANEKGYLDRKAVGEKLYWAHQDFVRLSSYEGRSTVRLVEVLESEYAHAMPQYPVRPSDLSDLQRTILGKFEQSRGEFLTQCDVANMLDPRRFSAGGDVKEALSDLVKRRTLANTKGRGYYLVTGARVGT